MVLLFLIPCDFFSHVIDSWSIASRPILKSVSDSKSQILNYTCLIICLFCSFLSVFTYFICLLILEVSQLLHFQNFFYKHLGSRTMVCSLRTPSFVAGMHRWALEIWDHLNLISGIEIFLSQQDNLIWVTVYVGLLPIYPYFCDPVPWIPDEKPRLRRSPILLSHIFQLLFS